MLDLLCYGQWVPESWSVGVKEIKDLKVTERQKYQYTELWQLTEKEDMRLPTFDFRKTQRL